MLATNDSGARLNDSKIYLELFNEYQFAKYISCFEFQKNYSYRGTGPSLSS